MKFTFENEFEYIPVFNNNREDSQPIKAKFRYLTTPEREKYIQVDYVSIDGVMERRTSFDYTGILKASLISLENCEPNGQKVTTAKGLLEFEGLSQLSNEMADYAAGRNITPDLKN